MRNGSEDGDIAIVNYQLEEDELEVNDNSDNNNNDNKTMAMKMEIYLTSFDLTVSAIFCGSYIKNTLTKRLYLAKFKEKEKENKYGNHKDIRGL